MGWVDRQIDRQKNRHKQVHRYRLKKALVLINWRVKEWRVRVRSFREVEWTEEKADGGGMGEGERGDREREGLCLPPGFPLLKPERPLYIPTGVERLSKSSLSLSSLPHTLMHMVLTIIHTHRHTYLLYKDTKRCTKTHIRTHTLFR